VVVNRVMFLAALGLALVPGGDYEATEALALAVAGLMAVTLISNLVL
jgi:hypothetical protein